MSMDLLIRIWAGVCLFIILVSGVLGAHNAWPDIESRLEGFIYGVATAIFHVLALTALAVVIGGLIGLATGKLTIEVLGQV